MKRPPTRRDFLGSSLAACALPTVTHARIDRPKRILLRSSWQTVNIGDIGHTPGVLAMLRQFHPDVEVSLWPGRLGHAVEALLRENFPKLQILRPDSVEAAFKDCDFLLHGSGPSLVGAKDVARWKAATGKPYGIYGITLPSLDPLTRELIDGARFVYFRDSVSLAFAKESGLKPPIMGFAPDGAFAVTLRNDEAATRFLRDHQLEAGKYLCVIPRLRYTPYWTLRNKRMTAEDARRHERNESMKEHDHAPLREAITRVTRTTDLKVLVCPEDESQMAVGREMLVEPLPADVKAKVVWRDRFWLPDEAVSTYIKSAGLFGLEMHSPIMAVGNGIPAIVCRFKEQTSKGLMWRDIGLGEWLFDMDREQEVERVVAAVETLARNPVEAKQKALKAGAFVRDRQRETMEVLGKELNG